VGACVRAYCARSQINCTPDQKCDPGFNGEKVISNMGFDDKGSIEQNTGAGSEAVSLGSRVWSGAQACAHECVKAASGACSVLAPGLCRGSRVDWMVAEGSGATQLWGGAHTQDTRLSAA
jgi:hypothetical protein